MLTVRNYRLYPSGEQRVQLAQHFGCCSVRALCKSTRLSVAVPMKREVSC
jgi:hypothetical protein